MEIFRTERGDLTEILELQKIAFLQEARLYNNYTIQPLVQTREGIDTEFNEKVFLKAVAESKIIGSIRTSMKGNECWVNKLIVHPGHQRKGIGMALLMEIEKYLPAAEKFLLGTGARSFNNIKLYEKAGYRIIKQDKFHDGVEAVIMEKQKE